MYGYFMDEDDMDRYYENLRKWAKRKWGAGLSDDDTSGDDDNEDDYGSG